MLSSSRNRNAGLGVFFGQLALAIYLGLVPGIGTSEILWSGDFDDGDLENWNWYAPNPIEIWGTPRYGGPGGDIGQHSQWLGNGDLMWLTAAATSGAFKEGPVLPGRNHSLGLHVKSYAGGSVDGTSTSPDLVGDYDGSVTTRRRTELRGLTLHWNNNYVPYQTTRWASLSVYLPTDWNTRPSASWGPKLWTWKSYPGPDMSEPVGLETHGNAWGFVVARSTILDHGGYGEGWNRTFFRPTMSSSPFYPDDAASVAALSNLNLGGWTHFVMQMHFDGRKSTEGGQGFIRLWMRAGAGPWVEVVHIYATPEYGVTHPQSEDGRWGFQAALYMHNSEVLDLPEDGRTAYYDNIKIGSEKATFEMMSHDGSSPGKSQVSPKAPRVEVD